MAEIPSEPLFSLIVLVLVVLYLFPFLNSRIESEGCNKVSRLVIVDKLGWNFRSWSDFQKLIRITESELYVTKRQWKLKEAMCESLRLLGLLLTL